MRPPPTRRRRLLVGLVGALLVCALAQGKARGCDGDASQIEQRLERWYEHLSRNGTVSCDPPAEVVRSRGLVSADELRPTKVSKTLPDCFTALAYRCYPDPRCVLRAAPRRPEAERLASQLAKPPFRAMSEWSECAVLSGLQPPAELAARFGALVDALDGPLLAPSARPVGRGAGGAAAEPFCSRTADVALVSSSGLAQLAHLRVGKRGLLVVGATRSQAETTSFVTRAAAVGTRPDVGVGLLSAKLTRRTLLSLLAFSSRSPAHRGAHAIEPTSALYALALALLNCKRVHAFGFGASATLPRGQTIAETHDLLAERRLVRFLASAGREAGGPCALNSSLAHTMLGWERGRLVLHF